MRRFDDDPATIQQQQREQPATIAGSTILLCIIRALYDAIDDLTKVAGCLDAALVR